MPLNRAFAVHSLWARSFLARPNAREPEAVQNGWCARSDLVDSVAWQQAE